MSIINCLGKTVAATQFPGNRFSVTTRVRNSKGKCHSAIISPFVAYAMFVCSI